MGSSHPGHPEQSLGPNAHQRDVAMQAVCCLQATLLDCTTVLENFMEDFNLPATTVPDHFFQCLLERSDRNVGQKHPFNLGFEVWGIGFRHIDSLQSYRWQRVK